MSKRKTPAAPELPRSHLEAIAAAGFEVISYQNKAIAVEPREGGEPRSEWLPEDLVHWEKRLFIRFRKATDGSYSFDGWEPINSHTFGGRYKTVHGALMWFTWLEDQKKRFA